LHLVGHWLVLDHLNRQGDYDSSHVPSEDGATDEFQVEQKENTVPAQLAPGVTRL
jgi:hypothetical protein